MAELTIFISPPSPAELCLEVYRARINKEITRIAKLDNKKLENTINFLIGIRIADFGERFRTNSNVFQRIVLARLAPLGSQCERGAPRLLSLCEALRAGHPPRFRKSRLEQEKSLLILSSKKNAKILKNYDFLPITNAIP